MFISYEFLGVYTGIYLGVFTGIYISLKQNSLKLFSKCWHLSKYFVQHLPSISKINLEINFQTYYFAPVL